MTLALKPNASHNAMALVRVFYLISATVLDYFFSFKLTFVISMSLTMSQSVST